MVGGMREAIALGVVMVLGACGGSGRGEKAAGHGHGHGHGHGEGHGHGHGHGHGDGHFHKRFEDAERWAKVFDDPARDAWQKPDEVVGHLSLAPGMTVVDVGAGTGYFLSRLSRAVGPQGKVVATDIEPDMVRYMTERAAREGLGNVTAIAAPSDGVGVPDGSADRILIVDVWHHIPARDRYAAALARALAPGGEVHVVDFTVDSERGPPREHRLPPETVIAELAAGGLVAEAIAETLPDQYIVVARRR
jgi:ubiquinone/menaquinone biosynthesis C-methylase UbiE